MKSTGWYLGLRYMQGSGLIARVAEPVGVVHHGTQFIFADRVLCGNPEWRAVLANWFDALAVGGHLILWLPDCRYGDPEKTESRMTLPDVTQALDHKNGWLLCESDLVDGHIYVVWQKRGGNQQIKTPWRKQAQHMLIARTGAHGDALMASSILPWLKEQGWHISFITRNAGAEALKHDPHIDDLIVLQHGQVTDDELPYYWQAQAKRFDRFVNLTHSVEGELLKQPARDDYWWPDDQRRAMCDRSYLGYLHKLANVPGPYRVCFYPNDEEKMWAADIARSLEQEYSPPLAGGARGGMTHTRNSDADPSVTPHPASPARGEEPYGSNRAAGFILWCLRGSSVHKWWPYTPQAICQLLARTGLHFILTGDETAQPLADEVMQAVHDYHGDTNRIHTLIGTHGIRDIMTLAHHAVAVVGPETGVLNAVSMQTVPKILLLSHSSPANLPDDWCNVAALKPASLCYPCHRLHIDHDWCPQDAKTQAAACAASISVEEMVNAILKIAADKPAQPWWLRGDSREYAA